MSNTIKGEGKVLKQKKSTSRNLIGWYTSGKKTFFTAVILLIVGSGANILGTWLLRPVVNDYIVPVVEGKSFNLKFSNMLIFITLVYVFSVFSSWYGNWLMVKVSNKTMLNVRIQIFSHLQKLPIAYFDTHSFGDIMSRFTNDVNTLRDTASKSVPQLVSSLVAVIGTIIAMLLLSPWLTLTVVLLVIFMFLLASVLGQKGNKYFMEQQKAIGILNGITEEMISGKVVIECFNNHEKILQKFDEENEQLIHSGVNALSMSNIMNPLMSNLSYIHYGIIVAVGASFVIEGRLDLGALVAFLQFTRSFVQPFAGLAQQAASVFSTIAGAKRLKELLEEPLETDHGDITLISLPEGTDKSFWKMPSGELVPVKGEIQFENVTFSYGVEIVMNNINFSMEHGVITAAVGTTGAGKTTISNLIARFYSGWEGNILFDGISIQEIKLDDLRKCIGIVLQDSYLFSMSVKDNIRYGLPDASENKVIEAAKLAGAHNFIEQLPYGYNTILDKDTTNLSHGQIQLITIARAILINPQLLILDEATSSVDTRTEKIVQKGIENLMHGRSSFVIAHRLSTVERANNIIVIENGVIQEEGKYEELLSKKGKFYSLYTRVDDMDF